MFYITLFTATCLSIISYFLLIRTPCSVRENKENEKKEIKKSLIYTRTGDEGITSLYNGERLTKESHVFSVLGDLDELSSHIGMSREYITNKNSSLHNYLKVIQSLLLDIGAAVATPIDNSSRMKLNKTYFDEKHIDVLENKIDEMDSTLEPLKTFIIPGGGKLSCSLHICRSVCRRAEREIWLLINRDKVDIHIGRFLNRLSDFFFVAARYVSDGDDIYIIHSEK